jgi:hypothetical protein
LLRFPLFGQPLGSPGFQGAQQCSSLEAPVFDFHRFESALEVRFTFRPQRFLELGDEVGV